MSNIYITILKLLCIYNIYIKYNTYIHKYINTKELKNIYSTICSLHELHSKDLTIDEVEFAFKSGSNLDEKKYQPYAVLFDELRKVDVGPEVAKTALEQLKQRDLLSTLTMTAMEALEGRKGIEDVKLCLHELDGEGESAGSEVEFVDDDLAQLGEAAFLKPGLRWRLKALNQSLGSLRKGDFGFVFARPETGKTTFLASEITHFATQLAGAEGTGPILWFNNEEQDSKVILRCHQAALAYSLPQLFSDVGKNKEKYRALTGNLIKFPKNFNSEKREVEAIVRETKPSLILFDQIDKIKGFAADREDLMLGSIYQWARELAKEYAPTIGVCQADGTGEGVRWLTMAHVANAKTSKQAEADWILGIGKTNDPGMEFVRYLHLSKNKLIGDPDTIGAQRHGRMEVIIEPEIARYRDPME